MRNFQGSVSDDALHAAGQEIFAKYGVPTDRLVGSEAAQEFIVLLSQEPLPFLRQVLPKLKEAADARTISENSYIYLSAVVRQREIQEQFHEPVGNPALRDTIEQILKTDQAPRQKETFDAKKMLEVDQSDGVAERAIFEKYGVPTYAMVGPQAAKDFALLIQHQPLDFQSDVLPKLKANVDKGQADPQNYAMMYDRVESNQGRPQLYGMNFVCSPEHTFVPAPIADPQNLERRRAEMGLMPLFLYSKILSQMYPKDFCQQVTGAGQPAEKKAGSEAKPPQ